jgi:hypothetical protein
MAQEITVGVINGKAPSGGVGGVTDADLANIARNFVSQGVVVSTDCLVEQQASPNMTVKVNTGQLYIDKSDHTIKYHVLINTARNGTITSNSSGNPRIDAVVVKVDLGATPNNYADNVATIVVVAGTPAGSPVAPTDGTIQTAVGAGNPFYRLANVTVANGASSIINANISSTRLQAALTGVAVLVDTTHPYKVQFGKTTATSVPNGESDQIGAHR